jgi:hypothetical protein
MGKIKTCNKRKMSRERADILLDLVKRIRNKTQSVKLLRKRAKQYGIHFASVRNSNINSCYYCQICDAYHTTSQLSEAQFTFTSVKQVSHV